ncbi:MAG TPA: DUF2768 domain-containing protein [Bacillota bacterium]|nr:DUF2768 domain-containing protein [Bacillota bacterium]
MTFHLLRSLALSKMWVSFTGIILLILSVGLILLSRHKLKGILKGITSLLAYISLILGGLIIFYIVLSGPTYS